jgi:hypothetical protein
MYNMAITHAVGLDEIALSISRNFVNHIPTRKEALDAVAYDFNTSSYGTPPSDMLEEEMNKAYSIARRLFPELNNEKINART